MLNAGQNMCIDLSQNNYRFSADLHTKWLNICVNFANTNKLMKLNRVPSFDSVRRLCTNTEYS